METYKEIADELRSYLRSLHQAADLEFGLPPERIPGGMEAVTFGFRLQPHTNTPDEWHKELVVRLYASENDGPQARQEFETQVALSKIGFPAARPLLVEPCPSIAGHPFIIMERLSGRTMLSRMLRSIGPGLIRLATLTAETHASLHALRADHPSLLTTTLGSRHPGTTVDRLAEYSAGRIRQADTQFLLPVLDWLIARRPEGPLGEACVLHLDFHPANILVQRHRVSGVLDWSKAELGDYHFDVAKTMQWFLFTTPRQTDRTLARIAGRSMLRLMGWFYLRRYAQIRTINKPTLLYYRVWTALRRLTTLHAIEQGRPDSIGLDPSLTLVGHEVELAELQRFVRDTTGIKWQEV